MALSLVQAAGMFFALSFGVLSEKIGLKKCFLSGLIILGCASIGGLLTDNIYSLFLLRFFEGIGFLPSIYLNHQIQLKSAGALTAFVSIANILGTLAAGLLLHRGLQPKTLMRYGFGTMLLMSWITFYLSSYLAFGWQYLSVILFSTIGGFIPATVFSTSLYMHHNIMRLLQMSDLFYNFPHWRNFYCHR